MKIFSLALLFSLVTLSTAQATDAYCPLYEYYPYPPDYVYVSEYFSPHTNCPTTNPQYVYDIGNFSPVPYVDCDDCRLQFAVKDKPKEDKKRQGNDAKKNRSPDQEVPAKKRAAQGQRGTMFEGMLGRIDVNSPYDVPPGPDRTGPEGKPDGLGDAQQYSEVTDIIHGEKRIVQYHTPDGRDVYAKVFQVKMDLTGRRKGKPYDASRATVMYVALQLFDKADGYVANAKLSEMKPGDTQDVCCLFIGKCGIGDDSHLVQLLIAKP